MRSFRKQVNDRFVRFLHQVIYNQQDRFAAIKVVSIGKSLVKNDSRICGKHVLVLSVAVDNLARRRIYHSRYIIYESKYEYGLAA